MAPQIGKPFPLDQRRDLFVGNSEESTLQFCVEHFFEIAEAAIKDHHFFRVALSGGHTPAKIFSRLIEPTYRNRIDWSRLELFWSDERAVPPTSLESNYRMAMQTAFATLGIPPSQIHRMEAEQSNLQKAALDYEARILAINAPLDLVMLGMGDDGHTASLFPHTEGLKEETRLVIANEVPQKKCWRMTFTYKGIHNTRHIALYVLGANKLDTLKKVLLGPYQPEEFPSQKVGIEGCKALWITDQVALLQAVLANHVS